MNKSFYYIFGSFLNAGIPFLFMPILTRVLTPDQYGTLSLFMTIYAILVPVVSIGMPQYIFRIYFDAGDKFKESVKSSVVTVMAWSIVVFISSLAISSLLYISGVLSLFYLISLVIIAFSAFLNAIFQLRLLLFNAQGNALNYIVFQFTYTLVIFIVTLLALFWSGIGEFSRVFGIFVADFVFAVIGIRMVFKDLDISFSLPTGTLINFDFLKFGIGLVPHLIASVLLSSVDKVLIASRLSMTDLASYAIAVQFTSILMIYTQGIGKEWSRCYMANRNEGWVVKRGVTFTVSIFVIAAITYATKSVFFLIFVGEGYTVLDNVIIALLIGQICHAVYMIVSVEIIYQRKTHILSTLTVLSLTINIIVSLLLVEQYGVFGVALGTMAGMAAKVTAVSIFTYSARMQLSTGK